jgi:hypothetical protein
MKTEYMNDLPYPNDLPQEVDRWVTKCISCNLQFVKTLTYSFTYADSDIYLCWRWHLLMLTLTFTYADADMYPNVHVILKLPVHEGGLSRLFGTWRQKRKIACVGWRCFTSTVMIHTGRWIQTLLSKDGIRVAIGKSILYSPTKYCHLKKFIQRLF